jgi:CarD family transcriptional regulator
MFKVGEYVLHTNHGICKIDSIESIVFNGAHTDYFVLHPIFGEHNNIVLKIPVSNENYLDPVLTKTEVNRLFDKIRLKGDYWNDNPMKRNIEYKLMFQNKDFVNIAIIIRSINNRKNEAKKLSATDKKIYDNAKLIFFGLCSLAYNIDYDDVETFFYKQLNKK